MNILDNLKEQLVGNVLEGLAQKIGVHPDTVTSIIDVAGPEILGTLKKNTESGESEAIENAIDNHDGSILGKLGDILGKPDAGDENDSGILMKEGSKILGHVFKENQGMVTDEIGKRLGVDASIVEKVMQVAGPLVMENLGKKKRDIKEGYANNSGGTQIEKGAGVLGNILNAASAFGLFK